MKRSFWMCVVLCGLALTNTWSGDKPMNSIYDIPLQDIRGNNTSLGAYKGQVLLVVNVASKCGFTKQYTGLEALQKKYQPQGLQVLGFPSNDFGGQEPGTHDEIVKFCTLNYGVTFPLFAKLHTKGDGQHPLYAWLTTNAPTTGDVSWNFEKFLISKDGKIVGRFKSAVTPESPELVAAIESELKK